MLIKHYLTPVGLPCSSSLWRNVSGWSIILSDVLKFSPEGLLANSPSSALTSSSMVGSSVTGSLYQWLTVVTRRAVVVVDLLRLNVPLRVERESDLHLLPFPQLLLRLLWNGDVLLKELPAPLCCPWSARVKLLPPSKDTSTLATHWPPPPHANTFTEMESALAAARMW